MYVSLGIDKLGIHVSETVMNRNMDQFGSQRTFVKHDACFSGVECAKELDNTVNVGVEEFLHDALEIMVSGNEDKLAVSSRNAVLSDHLGDARVFFLTQNSDESRAGIRRQFLNP
jgi:hypothetical protein